MQLWEISWTNTAENKHFGNHIWIKTMGNKFERGKKNCLTLHSRMVDETSLRQSSRPYLIPTIYTYTYLTLPHSHLTISKVKINIHN